MAAAADLKSAPEADAKSNGCIVASATSPQFSCNLHVDYATEDLARVVMVTLSVDPELRPEIVRRELKVEGKRLLVSFTANEARPLRASFTAFMDMLILATRTVEEFGPGTKYMP